MNALILDDDRLELEGMIILTDWKRLGIDRIFTATCVAAAKKIVLENQVDIALCDIELPVESGLDFVRWMVQKHLDVVVIFVTSYARFEYAAEAIRLQARDYILKPVAKSAIEESIRSAMDYRRYVQNGKAAGDAAPVMNETEVVRRTKTYVQEHLRENITREAIAKIVYLHPDYLSHIFHENTGITLSDYILKERIKLAQQQLVSCDQSISDIALDSGFSNTSYFAKMFRRCVGCTPKKYREQQRSGRDEI